MSNKGAKMNIKEMMDVAIKSAEKQVANQEYLDAIDISRVLILIKTIERLLSDKDIDAEIKSSSEDVLSLLAVGMDDGEREQIESLLSVAESITKDTIKNTIKLPKKAG